MTIADVPLIIAIGASGREGLNDIRELLKMLGRPPHAVVMVVLHRPRDKISLLRDVLARSCDMPVVVVTEALALKRGTCYIGEPDGHLTLIDGHYAHLVLGSNNKLRNRDIDALFTSLAVQAGARTLGIVLSGSLDDGSRGLAAIHAARGLTMVLDPGLKPRGMQQNAIDYNGPISFIGSAIEIAAVVQQVTADDKDFLPTSYALVTTDDAGQILGWNAGAAALFGWEQAEVCGQSYACLFFNNDLESSLPPATLQDLRASRFNNGERWCIRRDGSRFWANSVMLSQEADGLSGLVIVLRDRKVSRQDATPTDADYRLLAEMIPQLVWRARDDGEWDWAGPQWVAYTGQAEGTCHGQGWQAMVHPDDQAVTRRAWQAAAAHGGLEVEHRLRRSDGIHRWFLTRATPLEDAGPIPGKRLWFGTSTDIDNLRAYSG